MAPHSSLLFVIIITALGLAHSEETPVKCRFGGAEYDVGRTWHPRLETQGAVFCVTCRCYQGGKMNCTSKQCPVNCSEDDDTSECCNICAESSRKPVTTDMVACIYEGRVYNNREVFYPNSTTWSESIPRQCVQCKCQDGLVLCEEQVCETLICQEPIHMQNKCCPQCPEEAEQKGTSSMVTFKGSRDQRDKDCISSGKYYVDGSTWHPVIGPFGPMDCVMCKCNAGTIECNRFKCPSMSELPCSKPVKQFGQCCPVCPIKVMSAVQEEDKEEDDDDGDGTGLLQCIPSTSEILIYRAQGAGNLSEFLQYAFQQPGGTGSEVELHIWVLHTGSVHSFQVQTITENDFEELRNKFQFVIIGTTSLKRVSKFGKREKKLKRRCKAKCNVRIKQLEEMLIVDKVSKRRKCHTTETALSYV